uniref:Uncharacterized protein n=1 Tax=Brassica campestris TaxID=3711 RepID=A0A3P6CRI2_BRACM|nr:unnamed protein product [Brassica rapa]
MVASSDPGVFFARSLYADPMILKELHDKDERIGALEEQHTTILSERMPLSVLRMPLSLLSWHPVRSSTPR